MNDEELKQIDDALNTKEAEAFAKNLASEAKKKKARKSPRKRRSRQCSAGQCKSKGMYTVIQVRATVKEGEEGTITFTENSLIQPSCYNHAKTMLRRFQRIEVPHVQLHALV